MEKIFKISYFVLKNSVFPTKKKRSPNFNAPDFSSTNFHFFLFFKLFFFFLTKKKIFFYNLSLFITNFLIFYTYFFICFVANDMIFALPHTSFPRNKMKNKGKKIWRKFYIIFLGIFTNILHFSD